MTNAVERLKAKIGEELGRIPFTVTQKDADMFSALTDDWDYMHNDPDWAAGSDWGGTIAHGLYVLSLVPSFMKHCSDLPVVSDDPADGLALNYGFDRVRFVSPLPTGAPAHARVNLVDITDRNEGNYLIRLRVTVWRDGDEDVPMMVAENLAYFTFDK